MMEREMVYGEIAQSRRHNSRVRLHGPAILLSAHDRAAKASSHLGKRHRDAMPPTKALTVLGHF